MRSNRLRHEDGDKNSRCREKMKIGESDIGKQGHFFEGGKLRADVPVPQGWKRIQLR